MALLLSPAKLVLLAVHFAVQADIGSLTSLAARHGAILRKELLLRIVLTYLPETLPSSAYVGLLEQLEDGGFNDTELEDIDCSAVTALSEEDATRKVRKLRLQPLAFPDIPADAEDETTLFLLRRAYKVDEEAGFLDQLPSLLMPFLDHSPCIRTLMVSTILPLLRRNCEYYPQEPIPYTLLGFQELPDRVAVNLLLSQTGVRETDLHLVGRDLKGLVGPWIFNEKRWKNRRNRSSAQPGQGNLESDAEPGEAVCPGWEQVMEWLTSQASKSWRVAVSAIEQWDGPGDVDLGGWGAMWFNDEEQDHLEHAYARAALACAYLIPEASPDSLDGAYRIVAKIAGLLDQEPMAPVQSTLAILPPLAEHITSAVSAAKHATHLRNNLLDTSNVLTSPTPASTIFLQGVILSALLLTKAGSPCTVRRAGELALLQDEREQRIEATKLITALTNNGPKTDDKFWIKARNEILWLRDWGAEDGSSSSENPPSGIFGQVKREFLEVELLKALLANTRYKLARSIYEDSPDHPLSKALLENTVYSTAMSAYDNASNPNRTRGGLKKCDEIRIKALPKTIDKSDPAAKRIEALLQATHILSEYRLVLKQGEPFTPIVLRVHKDPISIIEKILEQNPKSYTRLQDFLDLGNRMVQAGLTAANKDKLGHDGPILDQEQQEQRLTAEKRITAMCIDAALTEDDFETAYSYVVNRLSSLSTASQPDDYLWKAALQAGKYRRTAHTIKPTHFGTTSGNPEIRHLEQRIECLSAALRIAPPPTLQEIINAFRRAEEELVAAIQAEDEQEDAWDTAGDTIYGHMPGGFNATSTAQKPSAPSTSSRRHQAEEAPMSLFDLSKASVMSAQRNLTALSSLQRSAGLERSATNTSSTSTDHTVGSDGEDNHNRVRKRDQLRNAAMGTLVSGVGWLVGAPAPPPNDS
ncbi:Sec39 domain-containing protein [Cercophora newfieldiana]|uniref:Sec39 domain-containing protein n=1 Tax=Cercophora newfieldiana TaxID=92897 RepID=A0AA40CV64_9PEZI|nr:Sec39 domain-containing protein [Cercophora newfieldiana]